MKKLLFLISLCLLSQNFTIASESFGESTQPGVPVPVNTPVPSSAITEEIFKKPPVVSSSSTPAQKQQTSTTILTKTLQKEVPPIATAATVNIAAAPVPAISAASAIKNVTPPVQKIQKPVITGVVLQDVYIGDNINDATTKKVLVYLGLLSNDVLGQVRQINIADKEHIELYTVKGTRIILGNLDNAEKIAGKTQEIFNDMNSTSIPVEYIDLSYSRPVLKIKQ